jgi:predicted DCC family thiol-disulfide oxidoreductase YuxK
VAECRRIVEGLLYNLTVARLSSSTQSQQRWKVLYDAECGLCNLLLAGLLWSDRAGRLDPIALQRPEIDDLLADMSPPERLASWHLIAPTGARYSGGDALAPLLRLLPGGRLPGAALGRMPALTERAYRWVADHRSQLSKWVPGRLKRAARNHVRMRAHRIGRGEPTSR